MKTNISKMNRLKGGLAVTCAGMLLWGAGSLQAAPEQASNTRELSEGDLNPETVAAVEKFMDTMKVQKNMENVFGEMTKMQDAMLGQQQLSDEQKTIARKAMAASMGEVEKLMSWDHIGPMLVRVYAKVFTTEEVNDLIKLFETPEGQVYINKQAELQAATMQEMQKIMMEIMPKIQTRAKAAVKKALQEDAKEE